MLEKKALPGLTTAAISQGRVVSLCCFASFLKFPAKTKDFFNDCINSKQTKKPKKREVFSINPVCGVLALRGGGRGGEVGPLTVLEGQGVCFPRSGFAEADAQ